VSPSGAVADGPTSSRDRPRFPAHATRRRHTVAPPRPGFRSWIGQAWRHRAAWGYFSRRFLQKRYGRTLLGYIWLFLPVVLPLFMGALVFGGILGVGVPGVPYFLYYLVALMAWTTFSETAYFSLRSLEIMRSDVRRVYVPRLIPFTSAVTIPLVTLLVYVILAVFTILFFIVFDDRFYLAITPSTLLAPVAIAMLIAFGLAVGVWFAPIAPRARDVRRFGAYGLGMWYFLTPVLYPISEIPEEYRFLADLNPVTTPIEIFKEALLGVGEVTSTGLVVYVSVLIGSAAAGSWLFARKERRDLGIY
jgi:lipopolysaccharide transport system permease protein